MKLIEESVKSKRKRFCKNKKKAWRKKINLGDIEENLEEKRREERFGGALGERPFEELFSLDLGSLDVNKGSKAKQSTYQKETRRKPGTKLKENKLPKCHEFLNGLPGVKPISKKGGVNKQNEMKQLKFARKISKNTPTAQVLRKTASKQRKEGLKKKKQGRPTTEFKEDLWNKHKEADQLAKKFGQVGKTFVEEPINYYKRKTGQARIKTPLVRFEKPSALPAVAPPRGGASYNPSYEDHQKLLQKAVRTLEKKKELTAREQLLIAKYLPTSKDGITEEERMQELLQGLPFPFNPNAEEETQENVESVEMPGKVEETEETVTCAGRSKPIKKSKQTRKKALTVKIKEEKRLQKKQRKKTESEVDKVKCFEREITIDEEYQQIMKKKREVFEERKKFKPKRLAKEKFEAEDIVVPLGHELKGSLRKIESRRDGLKATFKNLQRRNLIAPPVPRRGKKPKRKVKQIKKKTTNDPMENLMKAVKGFI